MGRTRGPYPREFREQMVELVRAGRSPEELAQAFEPSAGSIRNWVTQAELDTGRRTDELTTEEHAELRRLRRENRQLKIEREILRQSLPVTPQPGRHTCSARRCRRTSAEHSVRPGRAFSPTLIWRTCCAGAPRLASL